MSAESGFNYWVRPVMQGYQVECCKCGATHELEFRVTVAADAIGDASKTTHEIGKHDDFELRVRRLS